jgi:RHS repeat-associated protein
VGDHLGTTSLVLKDDGTVHSQARHYPYGEERWRWVASGGELPTDYRFTGQRENGYIKLTVMGARWYDAQLGRWISPDSIIPDPANPQSFDRYSYVAGNPLRYTDPSGHCWDDIVEWLRKSWEKISSAFRAGQKLREPAFPSWPGDGGPYYWGGEPIAALQVDQDAKKIVELGSGLFQNLAKIKRQNPDARVIGIEHPDISGFENLPSGQEAIEAGAELMFLDYTQELPSDILGADEVIAVAPQPYGVFERADRFQTANTMSDLVRPGGHIYVAAAEEATARDMALVFSERFGFDVWYALMKRSEIPYDSEYFGDEVWVIDFYAPD